MDAMLAEMTPRQFAEWTEADRLGVFDAGGWYQAGTIAAVIHNELEILAARFSRDAKPKWHQPSDYVPEPMQPEKPPEADSVAEFATRMESRMS